MGPERHKSNHFRGLCNNRQRFHSRKKSGDEARKDATLGQTAPTKLDASTISARAGASCCRKNMSKPTVTSSPICWTILKTVLPKTSCISPRKWRDGLKTHSSQNVDASSHMVSHVLLGKANQEFNETKDDTCLFSPNWHTRIFLTSCELFALSLPRTAEEFNELLGDMATSCTRTMVTSNTLQTSLQRRFAPASRG